MAPEPTLPLTRATELLRLAQEELARESSKADTLSGPAARWLCLVPAWTPQLATRCGLPGWAAAEGDVRLAAWRDAGLVESAITPLSIDDTGQFVPAQPLFWMPRDARAAWLSRIVAEDGRDRLVALMHDVAHRLLAQASDDGLPPATRRWATLAAAGVPPAPQLAATFDTTLDEALAADKPGEAWLWIEALQRVADVRPGEATMLHQRAVRRLALFDRVRSDRAFLRDYLPRAAQFEAWRELLEGPDDRWALHYLGGGGVGKTMLTRALTSGTAAHFPAGFSPPSAITARIDFDHVDPAFPVRKPGLLLAQLAEELRLKDEHARAVDQFSRVFASIAYLHESGATAAARAGALDEVIEAFAWACEALATDLGSRVVLLLDTCEELARLGPDGHLPESVHRTFDLLERLHARLPSLRVVLCGRRPLAGRYADGATVSESLPDRPWLRLHRMFPFSEREAITYLSRAAVPEALVPPILARSTAAVSSAAFGLSAAPTTAHYSPFSLSVYATWVTRAGSAVSAADILHDPVDHFVRIRILDRIHNADVRRLLPHVALLGRFDEATLRACADLRPDVADGVCREIVSQEWIARQAGGYYAVEGDLRARLLRYFRQESPQELHAARRQLLAHVATMLARVPETERPDEPLALAVVQLQAHDAAGALAAWRLLDDRIVGAGDAEWGQRVLGRLLADDPDGEIGFDRGALGAFLTTYAECLRRRLGPEATGDLWRRAWDLAQNLDAGELRATVLARAASGGLAEAVAAADGGMAFDTWAMRLCNLLAERQIAATSPAAMAPVIAALMACADAIERRGDLEAAPAPLERIAAAAVDVRRMPEQALALTCVARLAARRQDVDLARKRFADAFDAVAASHEPAVVPSLHWPEALDPVASVVLEAMRGLAALQPIEDTRARFVSLPTVREPIAANRLAALQLMLAGAVGVPEPAEGAPGAPGHAASDADLATPSNVAHLAILPAAVVRARDLVEVGRAAEGLQQLREISSRLASARAPAIANAVEAAYVDVVTRMRLGESGLLARHLSGGTIALPLADRERMRAFLPDTSAAVADEPRTRADRHTIWRARRAFDERTRVALARWGVRFLTAPVATEGLGEWARASVALDLVECTELGGEAELAAHGLTPGSPEDWWNRHPALPEHALRLWIRSAALGVAPGGPTTGLVRCVGVRRAASIALDEGELLALRLPVPALRLLALALTWYEDAHDVVGIWLVTTLLTLTRVRAGVTREAVDLGALHAAHDALVAQVSRSGQGGLIPWAELERENVPLGTPPAAVEWVPWLHRIVALQQWNRGGVRPEVLFDEASALPVELRDWPSGGAPGLTTVTHSGTRASSAPPPAAPAAAPPGVGPAAPDSDDERALPSAASTSLPVIVADARPGRRWPPWVGAAAFGAFGLALAIATLFAGMAAWIPILLAVVAIAAAGWVFARGSARPETPPAWTVHVAPTAAAPAASRLGALDVVVSVVDDAARLVSRVTMRVRRTDAYAGLDALRQPPSGTALAATLPRSQPLQRAWVDLGLATAWPCWEALLWAGTIEGGRLWPAVVRRVRARQPRVEAAWAVGRPWSVLAITASSGDERQALYAWEPAVRGGHVQVQSVSAQQLRQGLSHPEAALVHVVARTVDTPQGLFFEFAGDEAADLQATIVYLDANRGTLLDASVIAHACGGASVALIHPPRRPALDVSPATRETSAQLRILGAALAEHGIPVVVVLPPLDGELGAEIVRLLGRRLAAARAGRPIDVHEFTTRAREVVFTLAQRLLPRDPAIELALQVAVYVSSRGPM